MNESNDSGNIEPKLEKNTSINQTETDTQHADETEDQLSVNIHTEKTETLERTENMDASSEASQPLSPAQPNKDISSSSMLDRLESFENKVTSDVDQSSGDACQDIDDIEIVDTSDSLLNADDQSVSLNDTEEVLKETERESASEKLSDTLPAAEVQDTTSAVEKENAEELPNIQSTTECNEVQQGATGNNQKGDQLTEMVKDQKAVGTSISLEKSDLIEKKTEQADLISPLVDSSKKLEIDENDNKVQVEEAVSKMSAEETSSKTQSDHTEMLEECNLIDSTIKPVIPEQPSKEQSNRSLVSSLSCKSDVSISSNSVDQGDKLPSDTSGASVVTSDGKVNDINQTADMPMNNEVVDEQQPSHADQSNNDNSTQLEDDLQLSSDDSSDNLVIVDEIDGNGRSKEVIKNESSSQSCETSQSASDLPPEVTSESNEENKTQITVSSPLTSSKRKRKEPPGKRTQGKSVEKLKISFKKKNSNGNKKKDENIDNKDWVVSSSDASQEEPKPETPKYNLCAEDYEILKNVNLNDAVVKVQKLELGSKRFSQAPSSSSTPDASSPAADTPPQNGKVPHTRTPRNKTKKRPFSPTEEKMKKEESSSSPVPASRVVETTPTPTSVGKKKKKYSEEDVIKPFKFGWMREVVHRAAVGKSQNRQSDVYYFNPEGGKLRSMPEISKYLSDHKGSGLTIQNFTFVKETIYRHPFEQERDAKVKSAMTAVVDSSKRKGSPSVKNVETSVEKRKASTENKQAPPAKKARLKGTPSKSETPPAKDHKKDVQEKSTGTKETRSKDFKRNLTAQDNKIIDALIKDTPSKETKTKDVHVKDSHSKDTKTKDTPKEVKAKDTPKEVKVKDIQKDSQTKDSNRSKSTKASADWSPKLKSKRPTLKVKITKGPTKEKEVAATTTTPMSVAGNEIEQDLLQMLKAPVEKQTGIKADESSKKKAKIKPVTGRKSSKNVAHN